MIYDSIVIGKGLIGAAAAKYLSRSQQKVALIGPGEAMALKEGVVFSSHYDQARIQRIIGKDPVWTLLNRQSAEEYDFLEKEANTEFHSKVGCLYVNPYGTDSYLKNFPEQSRRFNTNYQAFQTGESLNSFAPDFNFPEAAKGIFEGAPSGHINPRLLIKAQLNIFQKNDGEVFSETVNGISYENGIFTIKTFTEKIFYSKNVLLANGSFINFFNLLKKKLWLRIKGEMTIWAKTSAEEANRLSKLPSLLYEIDEPEIQNIYLIRPLRYPDGEYYLKMGANFPDDVFFNNLKDIQDWYKGEIISSNLAIMQNALKKIMPQLLVKDWATKKCIVTYTKHGKPYIGTVNDGLFVATGGNGYGAMCSDALGKLAAHLLLNHKFPKEFSEVDFKPVFAD
jgi:glycine/D-amino acid oxidase-like deaminating enzyme